MAKMIYAATLEQSVNATSKERASRTSVMTQRVLKSFLRAVSFTVRPARSIEVTIRVAGGIMMKKVGRSLSCETNKVA
jgi:hypothetical protein